MTATTATNPLASMSDAAIQYQLDRALGGTNRALLWAEACRRGLVR